MRLHELTEWRRIRRGLKTYEVEKQTLPGIQNPNARTALVEQIIESERRVRFVGVIKSRPISPLRADPNSDLFDPIRAAAIHRSMGNIEEAYWLTFLFVHFGKHLRSGYRAIRAVYGALGERQRWDWETTSTNPGEFRKWLGENEKEIRKRVPNIFGNHRKYESLSGQSSQGTGEVIESYVRWVSPPRTHERLVREHYDLSRTNPYETFDSLFHSLKTVARFGRTARFDYLTMIGKLGLANIAPRTAYLKNATGPLAGARLLFRGSRSANLNAEGLENSLLDLDAHLSVGMQVLEDSLCNWQKSPDKFIPFRG